MKILELVFRTTATFALVMVLTRLLGKQTIARKGSGIRDYGNKRRLSILKKEQYMPVTKKDLHVLLTPNRKFPIEVIMDGEVIVENMRDNKLTQEWLDDQLRKRKVMLSEVCYAVLGTSGKMYIDLYKDQMNSTIDAE